MLTDYPDILLQVLAELRGAYLDGAENQTEAVELLAAQITDPTSIQLAYQEVTDMSDQAQEAVELLLTESGEMREAQFSRTYGSIRQMGPAKLNREQPWFYPESIAELLYYYGFVGRGFKGTGQNAHTIIYIPSDVIPWLPNPQSADLENGLPVQAVPPPPPSRSLLADDSLLADLGTLLGFVHTNGLRLTADGPHPDDVDLFVQRLQLPFSQDDTSLNNRLALMLHLANRMSWLRRESSGLIQLTGNPVHTFLEKTRAEQRVVLWQAWCETPDWNDLWRVPNLECTRTSNWQNDPFQTRQTVLQLLRRLQPGVWYSQSDVIQAIKETQPDFQRPTGDYDSWYIRNTVTQEFLKGFSEWDAVEGALLRFLFHGPLYWLQALDLAEPSAGDDYLISLSQWGAFWLEYDVPQPHEPARRPISVEEGNMITMPLDVASGDHFRVARFAEWRVSYPNYVYEITEASLARAASEGVTGPRILGFLQQRCRVVPDGVVEILGG